jgi:hypothetical protein
MKTTITLNGITQEIELTPEQERLFSGTGWERVSDGGLYYYTFSNLTATKVRETRHSDDSRNYNNGFYHSTKEHAIKQAKIDSLRRRMQRFADENYKDVEWGRVNEHWLVVLEGARLFVGEYRELRHPFQIYFGSKEGAEKAIELFGDEIKEMMGV